MERDDRQAAGGCGACGRRGRHRSHDRVLQERGLDLAIRGGGHNVAGNSTVEDGVVLDLGGMAAVTVDPAARTVRVEAGATLRHIDAATQPHGLAVPVGVVSGTGIAGLTLGGGVGWLTRPYGLAADNLLSVDLVTADGEAITASSRRTPICSGRCAAGVATSAWSPPSRSAPTPGA